MANPANKSKQVETTGHVWDGDLREYNNPLPNWWLWAFYATIIFAVVYWIIYPAWPVGKSFTRGIATVTVEENGQTKEMPWNSRSQLIAEMQSSPAAVKQREYIEKVGAASYEEILANPDMMAFARSMAKGYFGDYCAACHGQGGQGNLPFFPNLADDDWLWGGKLEDIQQALVAGRKGNMPAFANIQGQALDDLASYVLSLSGEVVDAAAAERGKQGYAMCMGCHGAEGKGNPMMGAANLTDKAWSVINIPAAGSIEEKKKLVAGVINKGIQRQMPAFGARLKPEEIKMLTVYVHQLGGGK
ncbi:MAG: cytochrome-c oxidase, cbb3-type subunit III [Halothiobacillaceae bacterium]|jgi:cytochrome c oxidase cbb3-type subunit 3